MTGGLVLTYGDILTERHGSRAFLQHLVDTDNAILVEDYETKVVKVEETKEVIKKKRGRPRKPTSA